MLPERARLAPWPAVAVAVPDGDRVELVASGAVLDPDSRQDGFRSSFVFVVVSEVDWQVRVVSSVSPSGACVAVGHRACAWRGGVRRG